MSYEASKADCIDTYDRLPAISDTVADEAAQQAGKVTFEFKVWFDGEPAHDGELKTIPDGARGELIDFEVIPGALFTVRIDEQKEAPFGFFWEKVESTKPDCLELKDSNLGGLKTTFKQFLFMVKADADPANCADVKITFESAVVGTAPETAEMKVVISGTACDPCE